MATCNAGHGCSITCPNGCGAIYSHSTGKCTKWCDGNFTAAKEDVFDGEFTIEVNELPVADLVGAIGERHLGGTYASFAKSDKRVSFKLEAGDVAGLVAALQKHAG